MFLSHKSLASDLASRVPKWHLETNQVKTKSEWSGFSSVLSNSNGRNTSERLCPVDFGFGWSDSGTHWNKKQIYFNHPLSFHRLSLSISPTNSPSKIQINTTINHERPKLGTDANWTMTAIALDKINIVWLQWHIDQGEWVNIVISIYSAHEGIWQPAGSWRLN